MVEAIDAHSCFASVGSDTPRMLAFWLAMVGEEFDAGDHPELAEELRALAERYLRAAGAVSAQRSRPRAITMRWMSEVPSSISSSLASRIHFSTGYSRE